MVFQEKCLVGDSFSKKLFIQHLIKHKKEVLENLNGRKKIYEFLKSKRFSMMEDMSYKHLRNSLISPRLGI